RRPYHPFDPVQQWPSGGQRPPGKTLSQFCVHICPSNNTPESRLCWCGWPPRLPIARPSYTLTQRRAPASEIAQATRQKRQGEDGQTQRPGARPPIPQHERRLSARLRKRFRPGEQAGQRRDAHRERAYCPETTALGLKPGLLIAQQVAPPPGQRGFARQRSEEERRKRYRIFPVLLHALRRPRERVAEEQRLEARAEKLAGLRQQPRDD